MTAKPELQKNLRVLLQVIGWAVLVFAIWEFFKIEGTKTQKLMMVGLAVAVVVVVTLLARIHAPTWYVAFIYGLVAIGLAAGVTSLVLEQAGFFGSEIKVGPRQVAGYTRGIPSVGATGGDSLSFAGAGDFDDPAFRAQFLTWVRDTNNIKFDSITHGQSDRNYMDTHATRGLIVAADNIHNTPHSELGPHKGRVLWRIRMGDSGYRYVGVPAGVSFVFVDSFVPKARPEELDSAMVRAYVDNAVVHGHHYGQIKPDTMAMDSVRQVLTGIYRRRPSAIRLSPATLARAGTDSSVLKEASQVEVTGFARGIIIPENPALKARVIRITIKRHYEYWWNRPVARWMGPGTYHPWSNCDTHGCCEGWCLNAC